MRAARCVLMAVLFLTCLSSAQTSSEQAQRGKAAPLHLAILTPPTAFRADGQWHLCYEIFIDNLSSYSWTVQRIQAKNEQGAVALNVSGAGLDSVLFHPALARDKKPTSAADLAPGESLVAYLWIDLPSGAPIPTHLQHTFAVTKSGDPNGYVLDAPGTPVATQLPLGGRRASRYSSAAWRISLVCTSRRARTCSRELPMAR